MQQRGPNAARNKNEKKKKEKQVCCRPVRGEPSSWQQSPVTLEGEGKKAERV